MQGEIYISLVNAIYSHFVSKVAKTVELEKVQLAVSSANSIFSSHILIRTAAEMIHPFGQRRLLVVPHQAS
jgi:hypothetical protein